MFLQILGFTTAFLFLLNCGQCDRFTATISLAAEYPVGDEVVCAITITNNHDQDYFFLERATPFEGLNSPIFTITEKGKPVEYDGFLFKRGSPSKQEYVLVKAKSSLSTSIDLSLAYSFGVASSEYTVKLDFAIRYFKVDHINSSKQYVHSNTEQFSLTASEKQPKLTEPEILRRNSTRVLGNSMGFKAPKFGGTGSSSDKSTANVAYNAAYNVLGRCVSSVNNNVPLFKKWFANNQYYSYYQKTAEGVYLDIKYAMETSYYTIYFHGPHCGKDFVAYTYHRATTIYMCDGYFSAPTTGTDSKMGTIVHEMSHAVALTEDYQYGQSDCQNLAINDPTQAVKNADNYEYFAESQ